jgi:hypothetical protein
VGTGHVRTNWQIRPQKGACMWSKFYRPRPWGLPGAAWWLAPFHQLVGALDPPAVTSVSAPNTRSLVYDHCGVGPGLRPVLGQVSPKRAGCQGGLGSSRFLVGFRSAAPAGPGGARRSAAREGKNYPVRGHCRVSCVVTLRCYCARRSRQSPCSGGMCDGIKPLAFGQFGERPAQITSCRRPLKTDRG